MKNFLMNNYWKLGAVLTTTILFQLPAYANTITGGKISIDWPWIRFFNSMAEHITGELATTLGIAGVGAAAVSAYNGNNNLAIKMMGLAFAVCIAKFAPTFINAISSSGSGMLAF